MTHLPGLNDAKFLVNVNFPFLTANRPHPPNISITPAISNEYWTVTRPMLF